MSEKTPNDVCGGGMEGGVRRVGWGRGGQGCSFWEEQHRKVRMRAHTLWFSNDVVQLRWTAESASQRMTNFGGELTVWCMFSPRTAARTTGC